LVQFEKFFEDVVIVTHFSHSSGMLFSAHSKP